MEKQGFLNGLSNLELRLIEVCRAMAEDDKVFVSAIDLLKVIALNDFHLDEESFEEECETLNAEVLPLDQYPEESVGKAYRTLLQMGLPWRKRYPLFSLSGMIGDFHDEVPFGPESVELRLSKTTQVLLPIDKKPLLPLALLNGVKLSDGSEVPPHNLEELWLAMEHVRQEPNLTLLDLMEVIPGPDFGPGGTVCDFNEVYTLYEKGEGFITLRGEIDTIIDGGRTRVAIKSLPHGVLIQAVLEQIRALSLEENFPFFIFKDTSQGMNTHIVIDMPPALSAEQLKSVLYQKTDLERSIRFKCAFKDNKAWLLEGPLISILKKAVSHCTSAWTQKDGGSVDVVPLFRDIIRVGGYKNPMTKLTDDRRTTLLKGIS